MAEPFVFYTQQQLIALTGRRARNHFHFFEARLSLERPTNDFSFWLNARGEKRLARAIDSLNPYVVSLDELKNQIRKIGRRAARKAA